jgi:hypothetical protein
MLQDRRKSRRHAAHGFVQIQNELGQRPQDCRLTDISDGGVRLYAENIEIADQFLLWLPGTSQTRRQCRVAWRLGHEVGAEFIDAPQPNFARKMAGGR